MELKSLRPSPFFIPLVVSLTLLVIFVAIATLSGTWPGNDFSAQVLAALSGAIVTTIITLFLLKGQTENEEKKDKDSKIFEEKLKIYKEFLDTLCTVVQDQHITTSEEIILQFQVASIATHTRPESIETISENVKEIILNIKNFKQGEEDKSKDMLQYLFNIAEVFHQELYGFEDITDANAHDKTIANFTSLLVAKDEIKTYEYLLDLMKKINRNESKQWIWNKMVLVHEYFTDRDDNNNLCKGDNTIAIDLCPIEDKNYITVFSRQNKAEATKQLIDGIWDGKVLFNPWTKHPDRHLYKVVDQSTPNEDLAKEMSSLLNKVKDYRNKIIK